jgi:NADH dehydrogenase FAD-containing subunit
VHRVFARLGVEVHEGTRVTEVQADAVLLDNGDRLPTDTVVWTTGFQVPDFARTAGFAVDTHGRLIVDRTLRSLSHPGVYAVGDAAAVQQHPHGKELRMACATALPSAAHAARAVGDRLAGREPAELRFRYINQCISLGRRDALVQFVRGNDDPVEWVLRGRFAALYKEVIVRSALATQRFPALVKLFPGGREPRPRPQKDDGEDSREAKAPVPSPCQCPAGGWVGGAGGESHGG